MIEQILSDYLRRTLQGEKPRLPRVGVDLLHIFAELTNTRSWHANGPNPISLPEIEAWCRLMRVPLQPHHIRIVLTLDKVWIGDFYKSREEVPEGVKKLPLVQEMHRTGAAETP